VRNADDQAVLHSGDVLLAGWGPFQRAAGFAEALRVGDLPTLLWPTDDCGAELDNLMAAAETSVLFW